MAPITIGTVTARELYQDQGESLDMIQIVGPGGVIQVGETVAGFVYGNKMAVDNVTANPGGGQANAVPIVAPQTRITTVGTAGDSVVLPVSRRGLSLVIINDAAANACNVFPASGDQINGAGANVAFSAAAQNGTGVTGTFIFYCFTAGSWRTK